MSDFHQQAIEDVAQAIELSKAKVILTLGFDPSVLFSSELAIQYAVAKTERVLELERDLELQKGANRAQDERERKASERLGMVHNCDWPDDVAERVLELEAQVKELSAKVVRSGDWTFMGKTPTELRNLIYEEK